MQLVATGVQDLYLTSDPQITFFKLVYRRHSNFSVESKIQAFTTRADFGKTVTCVIGRLGDLISKTFLFIQLPSNIKWPSAYAMIDYAELRIGEELIDRLSGEFMWIWEQLSREDRETHNKITSGYEMIVPLGFWFTKGPGSALPLVALSESMVQIIIRFKPFDKYWHHTSAIKLESNYGSIYPNDIIQQNGNKAKAISYDSISRVLTYINYDNSFVTNIPIINTLSNQSVIPIDNEYKIPFTSHIINAYLLIEYVYLSDEERQKVVTTSHQLLIEQVQTNQTLKSSSPNIKHKMVVKNAIKALYWISQLDNSSHFNYSTSRLGNEESLIVSNQLLLNDHTRIDISDYRYYNHVQAYQHHTNTPPVGLGMYSFAINPESSQPSGSINLSKIDSVQLLMHLNRSVNCNNTASVRSYALGYNILNVLSGVSKLMF